MTTVDKEVPPSRALDVAKQPLVGLATLGEQLAFYAKVLAWVPRTLAHYPREVLRLLSEVFLGHGALAVIGGTLGVMIGMTVFTGLIVGLQGYSALNQLGTSALTGFIAAYFDTREVAPLAAGLALSATVGCGFTAQLGAMRISEEIDALEVMAVPSLPYLVTTRVIAAVVRELDRDGWLCRIELGGLTEPEVAELVRTVVPAPFLGEIPPPARLVADTGGNVHLVLELLLWPCERRTDAEFSPAIHEYAAATLTTLDRAPRALLRAATVTGSEFELDLTAAAAGLGTSTALDALDTLLAAGIVTELSVPSRTLVTGGRRPYRFTHDVLRRAIRQQLSASRKRDLHTALADAIERRRANEIDRYTAALAYHRAAAGDPRAVRWVWRVAESAGAREAVRLHRKALRHVPAGDDGLRAEALTNLGLAELAAGERGGAQTLLDGALHAVHSDRIEVATRAALGLADGVELFPELRDEAAALVDLLVAETGPLDGVTVGRLLARQLRLGSRLATAPAAAALSALAERLSRLEGPDQVRGRLALASEMLAVATEVHDTVNRIIAAHHQAMAAELLGDLATRQKALAALSDAVIATAADPFGDALLLDQSVATAVTQGRFTDAAAITKLASGLPGGQVHGISPAPGSLARRQMLVAGLLRWSALPATETDGATGGGTGAELAERTLRALAGGDRGRPHLTVRAFATGARALPATDEWPHLMGVLAIGGVEVGDPTTAEALLARLEPYAELVCGVGYRTFVGPASLHLGRLSTVVGEWDAAERYLTSSLSYLDNKRARPWTALAKHSLARALEGRARANDRRFARTLRMEANSSLAHLGLRHCAA